MYEEYEWDLQILWVSAKFEKEVWCPPYWSSYQSLTTTRHLEAWSQLQQISTFSGTSPLQLLWRSMTWTNGSIKLQEIHSLNNYRMHEEKCTREEIHNKTNRISQRLCICWIYLQRCNFTHKKHLKAKCHFMDLARANWEKLADHT